MDSTLYSTAAKSLDVFVCLKRKLVGWLTSVNKMRLIATYPYIRCSGEGNQYLQGEPITDVAHSHLLCTPISQCIQTVSYTSLLNKMIENIESHLKSINRVM